MDHAHSKGKGGGESSRVGYGKEGKGVPLLDENLTGLVGAIDLGRLKMYGMEVRDGIVLSGP